MLILPREKLLLMNLVVVRTGRGLLSMLRLLGLRDFFDTRTCHRPPACLPAASVDGAGASCAPDSGVLRRGRRWGRSLGRRWGRRIALGAGPLGPAAGPRRRRSSSGAGGAWLAGRKGFSGCQSLQVSATAKARMVERVSGPAPLQALARGRRPGGRARAGRPPRRGAPPRRRPPGRAGRAGKGDGPGPDWMDKFYAADQVLHCQPAVLCLR